MIVKEECKTRADGVKLFHTYSDEGKILLQNETGLKYVEAIDVEGAPYTYSECEECSEAAELSAEDFVYLILGGDTI